jgi:hypothetical protein
MQLDVTAWCVQPDPGVLLFNAAARGEVGEVRRIVESGKAAACWQQQNTLRTPLHAACFGGKPRVVEALLALGAEIDCVDVDGMTPLLAAISVGGNDVAKLLIAAKASIDQQASGGKYAGLDATGLSQLKRDELDANLAEGYHPQSEIVQETQKMRARHAEIAALLSAEAAKRHKALTEALACAASEAAVSFERATTLHVLSTRYAGESYAFAAETKRLLELEPGVRCFNPNVDNAVIAAQDKSAADAAWLEKWREMLVRAKVTGGRVLQLLSEPEGLSPMQRAEADMAADKSVPLSVLSFDSDWDSDGLCAQLSGLSLLPAIDMDASETAPDMLVEALELKQWSRAIEIVAATPNAASCSGENEWRLRSPLCTPLHTAVINTAPVEVIRALLAAHPEAASAIDDGDGRTPLHWAAEDHSTPAESVRALLDAYPDGARQRDRHGNDFVKIAMIPYTTYCRGAEEGMEEMVKARDEWTKPEGLVEFEAWLTERAGAAGVSFEDAKTLHVLSTRFSGVSFQVARTVKELIEARMPSTACFNPNEDNLTLAEGKAAEANAAWLKQWRKMLKRAAKVGGRVVQLLSESEGLSDMQEAEEDMAEDKGVPVVIVRFREAPANGEVEKQLRGARLIN